MKRLSYPANLLHALRLNEKLELDLDYNTIEGVEERLMAQMEHITPREKAILLLYYKDRIGRKNIAEKFGISEDRVRQIIAKAFRKLGRKKSLAYLVEEPKPNPDPNVIGRFIFVPEIFRAYQAQREGVK